MRELPLSSLLCFTLDSPSALFGLDVRDSSTLLLTGGFKSTKTKWYHIFSEKSLAALCPAPWNFVTSFLVLYFSTFVN